MLIASIISLITLGLLVIFQIALIAGAPLGRFAWGGQHRTLPRRLRIASTSSIAIYFGLAALVLSKSNLLQIITNPTALAVSLWVATIYLSLGIGLNAISRSKPERAVMTSVAAILAICFFVIALS